MTIRKKLIQILAERYSPNVPLEKYYGEEADQILSLVLEAIKLEKIVDENNWGLNTEGYNQAVQDLEGIKNKIINN